MNLLSISCHYLYSAELSNLILIEEKLIAIDISYCFIIKFHIDIKFQKSTNVSYQKLVKNHITIFANDVVEIFKILSFFIDDVVEQIYVIWIDLNTSKLKNISILMLISKKCIYWVFFDWRKIICYNKNIEINLNEMRQWENAKNWMLSQFLADICYILDSEWKQKERILY